VLKIDNISKSFSRKDDKVRVLTDFSLTVKPGEIMTVQGASGCGKTTLLLTAAGLLSPDSGSVQVSDVNLYDMSAEARAAFRSKHIGVVFQQFHLMPYLNVLDNILVPTLVTKEPARDKGRAMVEQFGLSDRADHKPSELSIGERQRTALARALIVNPSLILADEPTANLDSANAEIVLVALREFARNGNAVLMMSHDQRTADFADHKVNL
jgi:putative ABC transport system ATP-binding protein